MRQFFLSRQRASPDTKFSGSWVYSEYNGDYAYYLDADIHTTTYTYTFNSDNNRFEKSTVTRDYQQQGADYNSSDGNVSETYEWKLDNGVYYYKSYFASDSDWQVFDLQYISENEIMIDGKTYTKA